MFKFNNFKQQKPRQFQYVPKYYNPESDNPNANMGLGHSSETREERMKRLMTIQKESQAYKKETFKKMLRTLAILFLLCLFVYYGMTQYADHWAQKMME